MKHHRALSMHRLQLGRQWCSPTALAWCFAVAMMMADIIDVAASTQDRDALSRALPLFAGELNPREIDSTRYDLDLTPSPAGSAPNIILIMTDDIGFGAASTFGGPIPTPNLERLAAAGLTYNRFHSTGVCAPSRAALLTGRNHHRVGTGHHPEMASPYPGYTGVISPAAATVARVLKEHGYNTAMFGKDHNTPLLHRSPMGPFDYWPTERGFEYFYGFLMGDTDQYRPALFEGTQAVDSAGRAPDLLLDKDLTDRTIAWLHRQQANDPTKPFFIYQAFGSAHAPQQAPADWIARFEASFADGWDAVRERTLARQKAQGLVPQSTALTPRPEVIPSWDSLSSDEQTVYAQFMAVYAAMVAYQDFQLGRLLDEIARMGLVDDTLIIFIEGDNGGPVANGLYGSMNEMSDIGRSPDTPGYDLSWLANNLDVMGSALTYQAIPAGWAHAMNTPFPWFKRIASHLGAVRNGLVMSWPARIQQTGLREQYHHIVDIAPTIFEAAGIAPPQEVDGIAQLPIDGVSLLYTFDDPGSTSRRQTQYYEIGGDRGIYHEGWLAVTTPQMMPWQRLRADRSHPTEYAWELYHLDQDFSQSRDLAAQYPERLAQLQVLFDLEARDNSVYPLQNTSGFQRAMARGGIGSPRTEATFWGVDVPLGEWSAPRIFQRSFQIAAEITIPEGGAQGVLFAAGSYFGGWSLFLEDNALTLAASQSPLDQGIEIVRADSPLSPGDYHIVCSVYFEGEGARIVFTANGNAIGEGRIMQRPIKMAGQGETLDSGRDTGVPVSLAYANEGPFTGVLAKLVISLMDLQNRE
jgi:arylsulfatase A-like enzyme